MNGCLVLGVQCAEREMVTIEGIVGPDGALHPVQQTFIDHDAFQCGYCTPGQVISAIACIREGHATDEASVCEWMSGNICRCSAYPQITAALLDARQRMGQPISRIEGPDKVTRRARYTADQNPPGVLYGVLVGSPVASGRLREVDGGAALRLPGVTHVLTRTDMPKFGAVQPPAAVLRLPLQTDEDEEAVALVVAARSSNRAAVCRRLASASARAGACRASGNADQFAVAARTALTPAQKHLAQRGTLEALLCYSSVQR